MTFESFYAEHYGQIYYWVLGQVRSHAIAEDIASETLSLALDEWEQIKSPKAWCWTTAHNLMRMRWRRAEPSSLDDPDFPEVASTKDFTEELGCYYERLQMIAAARLLNDTHRKAVARYLDGKPCQGTWASRLYKAKRQLKARINDSALPCLRM